MGTRTIRTCDVIVKHNVGRDKLAANPDADRCKKEAIRAPNGYPLGVFAGKNLYDVCSEHAALPLTDLLHALGLVE